MSQINNFPAFLSFILVVQQHTFYTPETMLLIHPQINCRRLSCLLLGDNFPALQFYNTNLLKQFVMNNICVGGTVVALSAAYHAYPSTLLEYFGDILAEYVTKTWKCVLYVHFRHYRLVMRPKISRVAAILQPYSATCLNAILYYKSV